MAWDVQTDLQELQLEFSMVSQDVVYLRLHYVSPSGETGAAPCTNGGCLDFHHANVYDTPINATNRRPAPVVIATPVGPRRPDPASMFGSW